MSSEIQVTGKKYRILTDVTNKVWTVISFVSKAVDTIFNDGKTAEAKLGAIDGITSDLSGESETIAASIKCVNELNSSLGGLRFGTDGEGNYGYFGADDSLIPFSEDAIVFFGGTTNNANYTVFCVYDGSVETMGQKNTSYTIKKTKKYTVVLGTFGVYNYNIGDIYLKKNGTTVETYSTSGVSFKKVEIEFAKGDVVTVIGSSRTGNTLYTSGFLAILV